MTRTLELPEPVYDALVEEARARGIAPSEWIASRLPLPRRQVSEAERKAARELMYAHIFSLGHATGTDNEQIDADLAREYGDTHEPS
jgi:hypothetical protein